MAADTRNIVFIFLIILLCNVSPCDLFSFGERPMTLHFPKLSDAEKWGKDTFHMTVDTDKIVNEVDGLLSRFTRATSGSSGSNTASATLSPLNDSRSTLIVHWAGADSKVIIALSKEMRKTKSKSSDLFVSEDYGKSFHSIRESLKVNDSTFAVIDRYYNSPVFNSHYVFADVIHNCTFSSTDYGQTFQTSCNLPFRPKSIHVHPTDAKILLSFDDTDPLKKLFYSLDFGFSWNVLQLNVKFFFWGVQPYDVNQTTVYIEEQRGTNDNIVIKRILAKDGIWHRHVVLEGVEDFEVRGPYLFATKRVVLLGSHQPNTLQLWVSYKRGEFQAAQFPYNHRHLDYYIADASEGQVMVCVTHNNSLTNLYISEVEGVKFSLSLERIVYFNPKGAYKDTWLKEYSNESFADIYKVEGMRGIFIASQVQNNDISDQVSKITFDKGGEWELLTAPEYKRNGQSTNCSKAKTSIREQETRCSLHLTQQYHQLYSKTSTAPITTKESAPGLILASGVLGQNLKGIPDIFLSSNAGFTWHQVLDGIYMYAFGDHGGIIVALQQYSITNQIFYSSNEGETWQSVKFLNGTTKIRIYGLLTEPGEATTIFSIFGSYVASHSWLVVQLDLKSIFNGILCKEEDYKDWSLPQSDPDHGCLLGKMMIYERRIAHAPCYNGRNYVREQSEHNCSCFRNDFECDFGFKDRRSFCVPDPGVNSTQIHQIPTPCPEGTFYTYTRGYRKVAGDMCEGGSEHRFAPLVYSCPIAERSEFILYTTRQSISRITLDNNVNEMLVNTGLVDVISVEFDYHDNCLYWADVTEVKIKKLCLGTNANRTIVDVIQSNLLAVEGLAYDWTAKTIYWVDSEAKKIEVASRDGFWRRVLISAPYLDKPRSIALDPHHGIMYWADWSSTNPRICSAWMDGTNQSIKTIVEGSDLYWPNGITIDLPSEKIFWTDAGKHVIMSADFSGNNREVIVQGRFNVPHPYSIGVYKNNIYWTDWSKEAVLMADKITGHGLQSVKNHLPSVTDLKIISHTSQHVRGACSPGNMPCSQLCLPRPHPDMAGRQNRTCKCGNDFLYTINPQTGDENCRCGPGETMLNGICSEAINSTSCSAERFHCANGECIPMTWGCDHDNDCSDGSDELNCPYATCNKNQFACPKGGRCIPAKWKCDFDNDCGDGSDESGCDYPACSEEQFRCDNGLCIAESWKCDFDNDCSDASDEKACNYTSTCRSWEFGCSNGDCIGLNRQCDGIKDCAGDGSDEQGCDAFTCSPWRFKCHNVSQCIFATWVCDSEKDCHDGSDEVNCSTQAPFRTTTYHPPSKCNGQFTCHNKFCIYWSSVCNGINDCGDHSDEQDCGVLSTTPTAPPRTCSSGDFTCVNGRCLHMNQRCNGINECGDQSDEIDCGAVTCLENQFHCNESSTEGDRQCIWNAWVCDNDTDCTHGEDERDCSDVNTCKGNDFKCRYSDGCIPVYQVCDKINQCPDGSDEDGCSITGSTTPSSIMPDRCDDKIYYKCGDYCLLWPYTCDGITNCQDRSDERLLRCRHHNVKVEGLRVVNITSHSISAQWLASLPQKPITYLLSYGEANNNETWTNKSVSTTQYTVQNLKAATQYLVTVYMVIDGTANSAATVQRVTTEQAVPSKPINVICSIEYTDGDVYVSITWDPPSSPHGNIVYYMIYYNNTNNGETNSERVADNRMPGSVAKIHSQLTNDQLVKNDHYSIWVTAVNQAGESEGSDQCQLTFTLPPTDVSIRIKSLETKNTSLDVSWSPVKAAISYKIYISYSGLIGREEVITTNDHKYTVTDLCPGHAYNIKIQSITKQGPGALASQHFTTKGMKLGRPTIQSLGLTSSTQVTIKFRPPTGFERKDLKYTIFYREKHALDINNPASGTKKIYTSGLIKVIPGLDACERYFFQVGVTGLSCPLSYPSDVETSEDDSAPPKAFSYNFIRIDNSVLHYSKINLTWEAPCTHEGLTLGYLLEVKLEGKITKDLVTTALPSKANPFIIGKLIRGAAYTFRVRTNIAASHFSPALFVTIPPYTPVVNLEVIFEGKGEFKIHWDRNKDDHPADKIFNGFEVNTTRVTNGTLFHMTKTTAHTELNIKLQMGYEYIFSVRYNKIQGYYSSSASIEYPYFNNTVDNALPNADILISKTNLVAIAVPVSVIIVILAIVLLVIGVRHRRLQKSFTAFANSHYDTRSGTTTFSNDDLGDEDTPMIQGFSDDEPLVLG